jgi:uncharacterized damage-inducible protein DinB
MTNEKHTAFRNNGAVGAYLDEYERAIDDLKTVLATVTAAELTAIADEKTDDPDCKSIQTVLAHIITAGYNYAIVIRKTQGEILDYTKAEILQNTADYAAALAKMFAFNVQTFADYPNLKLEEYDNDKKILVRWGQTYDIDQLMEHAVMHILRHRRQIERFLIGLRASVII